MKNHLWRQGILLALFTLSTLYLAAQTTIRFDSAVDKTTAQIGEAVHLNFGVDGADKMEIPNWPSTADFDIEYAGGSPRNSEMTYNINGKISKTISKSWVGSFILRPKHEGVLIIPSQSFRCQGQEFHSAPARLTVTAARRNTNFALRWSTTAGTLVEGQAFRLKLEFLYADQVRALNFSFPFLNNPDFSWEAEAAPSASGADVIPFEIGGKQYFGHKITVSQNGRQFNGIQFNLIGHPKHTGSFGLAGFAADISGKTGSQAVRDFFDQQVEQDKFEDISLQADPLHLEVRAIPKSGQPANFSGLVGQLQLKAESATASAGLGDPLDLKFQVTGLQGEVDPLPEIERQLAATSPLKVSLKDSQLAADGSRNYTFMVRFTKVGAQAIEAVVLDYFDPQSGQFRQAASGRLPVAVQAATLVGSANVQGNWGSAASDAPDGVADRALFPDTAILPFLGWPLAPWWVPAFVMPLWALYLWLGRAKRRQRRAYQHNLRQLIALPGWDEGTLGQLLPPDWSEWRTGFDRLRYSPPGAGRETWLAELKTHCQQELQR